MTLLLETAVAWRNLRILVFALLAQLALLAIPALAQQEQAPASPQITTLPVVPQQPPRITQGSEADQRWKTKRPQDENAPVASLVDSLRGSDAVIEVVLGQARLLTTRQPVAGSGGQAVIAVGDPTILDFNVLPDSRTIRLLGQRFGVTDLSITGADGQIYSFEVHVGYDLKLLEAQLRHFFPDARLKLGQIRDHLVVEGQARSAAQVSDIIRAIQAYLASINIEKSLTSGTGTTAAPMAPMPGDVAAAAAAPGGAVAGPTVSAAGPAGAAAYSEQNPISTTQSERTPAQIINLIRVPGVQQVMLQVRIAEVNRTGLREIGADMVATPNGNVIGTSIGSASTSALAMLSGSGLAPGGTQAASGSTTAFGIFPDADFAIFLRCLRDNSLLTVMAEPNLVTMSGHEASFLAGGQFPVPVPQFIGNGTNNTILFKDFGVQLNFLPFVQDDNVIRLSVTPEVSSIDFSLGTTLVIGGTPVPGLNTRRATTTVELRQGETLAIAGLLQVTIDGRTQRIPGLGDLPYIGPLFSNTTHKRIEKELLVLVTPHLVAPLPPGQVPCLPGSEINDPDDCEFYFLNRIENRDGHIYRSTTSWDDPHVHLMHLEKRQVHGPVGYSDCR